MANEPYADNFIPVVPVDYEYHTESNPFCYDEDCPCHTDQQAITSVKNQYEDGLLTAQEAEWTIKGKTV
jgi:hypothetical protein